MQPAPTVTKQTLTDLRSILETLEQRLHELDTDATASARGEVATLRDIKLRVEEALAA